jgi:hypothetical protein
VEDTATTITARQKGALLLRLANNNNTIMMMVEVRFSIIGGDGNCFS